MSILNPVEREQYAVGSVVSKLAKPLVKLFSDYSDAKAIKAEMVAVHKAVEKPRAGAGPTRKKIIETVAEDFDMTPSQVKNIEKIYAYRAGGGGGDENILGETAQTIRAMVTKPTSGQQISEELGGTKTTRAARRGKGFAALKTTGLLAPAVIGSNIYTYNLGSADEKKEAKKEVKKESKGNTFESVSDIDAEDMDAAFSKAFTNPATYVYVKGNKSYFKYKGEPVEFKFGTKDFDLFAMPVIEDEDMPRDKKWLGSYIKKYKPHLKKKKAAKKTNTASTNNQTSGSDQQGEADTSYVPKQTPADIETLLAKPRIKFNEGSESSYVRLALQYEKELERAKTPETRQQVRKNYNKIMGNFSDEERVEGQKQLEIMRRKGPMDRKNEGSLMVPPEMPLNMEASEIPVDTYTPEDQANAEETQLPDDVMEEEHIDFVVSESLLPEEQDYLVNALEADPQLSQIFDKVVSTASEFTGSGEVEGPGTGVSDSIPARLSDGEFVMTRKATDQIGADNLQRMMDDAERAYDGGLQKMNLGGYTEDKEAKFEKDSADDEVEKLMMASNRMPSVR
tara:strand:+ start:521 stop:2218 length:1698 start_codon:yes stop_codon:yes gene_type:complete